MLTQTCQPLSFPIHQDSILKNQKRATFIFFFQTKVIILFNLCLIFARQYPVSSVTFYMEIVN